MNRAFLICRLRWPLFLLLTGVIALLSQAHVLSWGHAWPLYLILWGVLALAERAAVSEEDMPPYPGPFPGSGYPGQYPGTPYQGSPYPGSPVPPSQPGAAAPATEPQTSIVPFHGDEITPRNTNGGDQQ